MKNYMFLIFIIVSTCEKIIAIKNLWIEQNLDHFNSSNANKWNMRYISNDEFFKPGGPIFIYIGAEWTITSDKITSGHFYDMANTYNAQMYYTEHRYYGYSRPTANMSVGNLKYLTVKQALADLAHFIKHQKSVSDKVNSKVILFGCSYAGTLATWLKREYPDLVHGIWATSAPLFYRLEFPDYMMDVGKSIRLAGGDGCYKRLKEAADKIQHLNDTTVLDELKRLNYFHILDEMENWVSDIVLNNNGSLIRQFCEEIIVGKDVLFTLGKALKARERRVSLSHDTINEEFTGGIGRAWLYQLCNEFGNFQTTISVHQPFRNRSPLTQLAGECKEIFGPKYTLDYINDQVEKINSYFGGYKPNVQNAYFTHGQLDPWRTAGVYDPKMATIIPDVSHCGDTHSIHNLDNVELKASKERIRDLVGIWLKEP